MTNPPIPPTVVEAMLAPICCDDGKCQKPEACTKDHWRPDVELSLSAALATGSVVICTPELMKLLEAADRAWALKKIMPASDVWQPLHAAALAFAESEIVSTRTEEDQG